MTEDVEIIEVNGEHVDTDTGEVLNELPSDLANVRDLAKVKPAEPEDAVVAELDAAIDLQDANATKVKQFCNEIVTKLVEINLPAHFRKNKAIMTIVKGQQALETLSLGGQLMLVTKAIKAMMSMSDDDIYNIDGSLDVFKLQAVMSSYQQVQQLIMTFTMHMRMLPGQIYRTLQDIQSAQTVILPANEVEDTAHGYVTSLPMAAILKQAEEQKKQMEADVYVKPERPATLEEQFNNEPDLNEEGI